MVINIRFNRQLSDVKRACAKQTDDINTSLANEERNQLTGAINQHIYM